MRNFLSKLAAKIRVFFYGRNGFDDLAKHSLIASLVLCVLGGFLPQGIFRIVISIASWGLMVYSYFRILSKNIYKRVSENRKYTGEINIYKAIWQQRKTHRFYRCPKCKTWLRVPKGRGKITITCVKCSTKFDKKT